MPDLKLNELLLPELEAELAKTRRILAAVPDGENEFAPHEKSMQLARLSGHLAELPGFASLILTAPSIDLASPSNPRKRLVMETRDLLLGEFDANAALAVATVKAATDETLSEPWTLSRGEFAIYSGSRYGGYRAFGVNHMIHHRAQLGTYIRLLNHTLPGTYGPSADGM